MTFREKQRAGLDDLQHEREEWRYCDWWVRRLDQKIADMKSAIAERIIS